MRHQGRPQLDIHHLEHEVAHMREGDPDAERMPHCPEPIHQPVYGQMQTLLLGLEEKWG